LRVGALWSNERRSEEPDEQGSLGRLPALRKHVAYMECVSVLLHIWKGESWGHILFGEKVDLLRNLLRINKSTLARNPRV
jgi:hypothetical protein